MEVYKFDDALIKKLKENGVKFIDLQNTAGEKVVPRNQNVKQLNTKITEVKTRLRSLPDGVYILGAYYNANPTILGDKYYIGKGKYQQTLLAENVPEVLPPAKRARATENESVNVLSFDQALKNIQKIATLEARIEILEKENAELKDKNLKLLEELREAEEESGSGSGLAEGVKEIFGQFGPMLPTLADQYFQLENRKLNLQEAKTFAYMQERGINLPGAKNGAPKPQAKPRVITKQNERQLPDVNDANALNDYCDYLETLDEEKFNTELDYVQQADPTLYAVLEQVFFGDEENESDD
jgi:hypothetical protein